MITAFRRTSVQVLLALCASASTAACAQNAPTPLGTFFSKVDLGVSGIGQFTPSTSGINYLPQSVQQSPSSTLGTFVEIHYSRSPHFCVAINFSQARFSENYKVASVTGTPPSQQPYFLGVQSKFQEFSVGYLVHGPTLAGLDTFGSVGGGLVEFKPTAGGGLGLLPEGLGSAYYAIGVQRTLGSDHFGVRAQFRQTFYAAPNFNQNYLSTDKRSFTLEPGVGFYLRF
jgi:hypothetical protein